MKTIRANQVKVHCAYFSQRDQLRIIAKRLTKRKVLFGYDVFVAGAALAS